MNETRIINFDHFCRNCKHKDESDVLDPCDSCLTEGGRIETSIPLNFEAVNDGFLDIYKEG